MVQYDDAIHSLAKLNPTPQQGQVILHGGTRENWESSYSPGRRGYVYSLHVITLEHAVGT